MKSSSVPASISSSTADARACICSVLSFARWIASPVSAIWSPIPVAASPIRTCASAAEYCALITSFCERNASIFACSCFSEATSFSCCCSSPRDLLVEILELALDERLALERLAREVLAAGGERFAGLRLELDEALLELGGLHLQPLLRGRHVDDAPLHVLEQAELLLVGVVERLRRVLGAVEQLRELRLDHRCGA